MSWKTTVGGVMAAVGAALSAMDSEAMQGVGAAILGLGVAFGLISARDNGVSSEQAGAVK